MCLYVRELTLAEGRRLTRVLKTTKTAAYLRRAQVVAFSGQGMRARAIAGRLYLHEEYVRELIRRFNAGGFAALRPRKASGRPSKYAPEAISVMLEVAGTRPHDLGLPFTVWSLRKLAAHLVRCGVVKELHATTLGRILRDQGFAFQRTKTWKESPDPDFAAKKKRLCALYRAAPPNARVICFDEFGPIEVRPYHGRAWRRVRHPARVRATYRRRHGTRQYLAAYDVADNRLMMRCYRRKRCREVLLFLKHIRSTYPRPTRLYLVLDNFSPHKRREVTDWAADHNVELVFTPTYASWLNRIEAIFSGVRYFALANSDYPDHEHSRRAILAYVAWRNRHRHTELGKRREKHKMSFATRH